MTKKVCWEIDVDADSPHEAAQKALTIQRKTDSTATVFDVTDEAGETVRVDLDEDDGVELLVCDNCGKSWTDYELEHAFPDIPGLTERIEPGGTVPAGECPTCGALVYPNREPVRVLVLLDGGLVQDVLADRDGVEVAVLDQDLEGADEEDIVEVVGKVDTLRGTLSAHEVTVAPALIESAWRPVEEAAT
ncbi:MAG: hypothetical protein HQ559_10780 [Lentisphaerae bacterium]|nr:hypothetical protein [Lentisphaerota bacterium]